MAKRIFPGGKVVKLQFTSSKLRGQNFSTKNVIGKYQVSKSRGAKIPFTTPFLCPCEISITLKHNSACSRFDRARRRSSYCKTKGLRFTIWFEPIESLNGCVECQLFNRYASATRRPKHSLPSQQCIFVDEIPKVNNDAAQLQFQINL